MDKNKFCHYGVRDEYGRLSYREDGNPLIIFEAEQIVRGVQVTMLDYGVRLELSLPSSKREIQFFYMIVEKMCATLGEEIVGKNGKRASIRDKDTLMQDDIKRSRQLLKKLDKIICDNDEKFFVRFQGVMSKIAIGKTGNKVIRKNIDRFGKHLHEIQKCDIFYGRPWIEDNKQSGRPAQGIVIIYEDCVMCIPENPMLEDRHPPVNIWFVSFRYKDRTDEIYNFWDYIKYADTSKRYDDERFVVSYSREEMKKISEKIRQNDK